MYHLVLGGYTATTTAGAALFCSANTFRELHIGPHLPPALGRVSDIGSLTQNKVIKEIIRTLSVHCVSLKALMIINLYKELLV